MNIFSEILEPAWNDIGELANQVQITDLDRHVPIMGPGSVLDSIGLVTFISAIEDRLEESLGKSVTLVTAEAMEQVNSPFKTLSTLESYIQQQIKN